MGETHGGGVADAQAEHNSKSPPSRRHDGAAFDPNARDVGVRADQQEISSSRHVGAYSVYRSIIRRQFASKLAPTTIRKGHEVSA